MSWMSSADPDMSNNCPKDLEIVILPRTVDIGNFKVHRALPHKNRRMVGPFIFWDQMGPGDFITGQGVDVRPHPHIGLSTVTYLFDGTLDHKDSLGNAIRIVPGEVNLMTAGTGIVHSERTGIDIRQNPSQLFGIQSWLAQPQSHENGDPAFVHCSKAEIPEFDENGVKGNLVLGEFQGLKAPAQTQWETLYLVLSLESGATITLPTKIEERALFLLSGSVEVCGQSFTEQQMIVLRPGQEIVVSAETEARIIVLGGAAMDGPRYIWWNFVSSSVEQIKAAAERWKRGNFPKVPQDEQEFIPLPDLPFPKTE